MSSSAAQIVLKNSSVADIDNLKVPELKKRLKSMGLSITGNKAELVERLQEAYLGEKEGSLDGTLDDESLEEALLNDDQNIPETSLMGGEEFTFSSPEKEMPSTKPLKKRAIIAEPSEELQKVSKPLVIKRNNYPTIEMPTQITRKDHPLIEPPKSSEATKAALATSQADKLQKRAERFNITESKLKVAASAPVKVSASNNLDVLRKRAERFGENVSTVMKQLESQEKLLKRKLKFNDSSSVPLSSKQPLATEQDAKKKRLERFGLVK